MPTPLMTVGGTNPYARPSAVRNPNLPQGINNGEAGFTRDVQDNELARTHLEGYLSPTAGNRYINQARGAGVARAASRGLANSSLSAAASESAAIDAAAPLAQFDAGAYQSAAGQNLQSLASQRMAEEQNATSIANQIFSSNTAAGIANADRDFNRERDQYTHGWQVEDRDTRRGWDSADRQQDRGWQVDDRNFNERSTQRRNREGLAATTIQNIFSNPEYFRDPQGAAGTIQFYQDQWDQMFPYGAEGGGP